MSDIQHGLLIVEDVDARRRGVKKYMEAAGWVVYDYDNPSDARQACQEWMETVHVALLDNQFTGHAEGGESFGTWVKAESRGRISTVLWTAYGNAVKEREVRQKGFNGYIAKGSDQDEMPRLREHCEGMAELADSKAEISRMQTLLDKEARTSGGNLALDLGTRRTITEIGSHIGRSLMPVLIVGQTGTGKENLALEIHRRSGLGGSFRAVNCAALTDTLIESELFGHQKGAFTDAHAHKLGMVLEAAGVKAEPETPDKKKGTTFRQWLEKKNAIEEKDGQLVFPALGTETLGISGTLFLDEVADLSLAAQTALLRFLDGNGLRPVGYSGPPFSPRVRVVAASNRTDVLFRRGREAEQVFRRDLLWRLAGWILELPPLHQREDDAVGAAMERAQRFWERSVPREGEEVGPPFTFSPGGLQALKAMIAGRRFSDEAPLRSGNFRSLNWLVDRACWIAMTERRSESLVATDIERASAQLMLLQAATPPAAGDGHTVDAPEREAPGPRDARSVARQVDAAPDLGELLREFAESGASEIGKDLEEDADLVRALVKVLESRRGSPPVDIQVWFGTPHDAVPGETSPLLSEARRARWQSMFLLAALQICGRADRNAFQLKSATKEFGAKREPFKKEIVELFHRHSIELVFATKNANRPLRDVVRYICGIAWDSESTFTSANAEVAAEWRSHLATIATAIGLREQAS